eukprot:3517938-Alexandrium_andersonii.AAC.1
MLRGPTEAARRRKSGSNGRPPIRRIWCTADCVLPRSFSVSSRWGAGRPMPRTVGAVPMKVAGTFRVAG